MSASTTASGALAANTVQVRVMVASALHRGNTDMFMASDFSGPMQSMMKNLPIDTSFIETAFRIHSQVSERMSRVALNVALRTTEISTNWTKGTLACMGELASPRDQPADYALAMAAFTTEMSELARQHMAAFANASMRVHVETVDLMMTCGDNIAPEAHNMTAGCGKTAVRRIAGDRAASLSRSPGRDLRSGRLAARR